MAIVTSMGIVMLPRMANHFANNEIDKIKISIKKSVNFVYFLAIPMMFGIIAVSNIFIPKFLGEGFEKSIYIINIITPTILFIGLSNAIGVQYLLPTKKQKQFTISVICGAIISLILNLIFIPMFMSAGAAIATVMAELGVVSVQFYYIRKEFSIKEIILKSH